MSEHNSTVTNGSEQNAPHGLKADGTPRRRRPAARRASGPKPVYLIMQLTNSDGQPVQASKDNVRIVGVERDAHRVLEQIDSGENQYAFYQRVMLPPMR